MRDSYALRILDVLAFFKRGKLRRAFGRRHCEMAKITKHMQTSVVTFRNSGWTTHVQIWNSCLFLNIIAHDISILVFDLSYERDHWKRRFLARSLALLLYETAEDIPTVFGKDFQKSLKILQVPEESQKHFRQSLKSFSEFWKTHHQMLQKIRVATAAHRDHDAISQLEVIDGIDLFELHGLAVELGRYANLLGSASQAIINFTSGIRPPELR